MVSKKFPAISLPKPTLDQVQYLQELQDASAFAEEVARRCNCAIGGPQPPTTPPCPIHGLERRWKVQFDSALLPDNIQNKMAAKDRGWHFDRNAGVYKDNEGALVADKFGQLF